MKERNVLGNFTFFKDSEIEDDLDKDSETDELDDE
jgi:hypothetical protein